ncbi:ABC transporter permease [Porphyrobacter algicida]|uniref:ABC transporter permease n=1 Tax=Qipengyuania algicida TaxID=1836209 RepID=A0A845AGQ7_9SPHN|nr:ABC transporter permease [Qipengyuania algicida]MXP29410.1 ABC transporter permease [Qipengyuania algicida]
MSEAAATRLSNWQAAWVIARRDFLAILFSRAFFFFLLGPLFPLVVGSLAGSIGGKVQQQAQTHVVALAMSPEDSTRVMDALQTIGPELDGALPALVRADGTDPKAILAEPGHAYGAVLSGTPSAPVLTGPDAQLARWKGPLSLLAASAAGEAKLRFAPMELDTVTQSAASDRSDRIRTAQAGQLLLFLLTMLLAGMVLSNLVEEKANKIIEVLAAAIPMDAVFMGKLVAMLGVSFVGIAVWGTAIGAFALASGHGLGALPEPALGWPLFIVLGIAYFAMGYLLLGSVFLAIGSLATTVREVQTLSMPVTMVQLLVFFLAAYTLTAPGSPLEIAVCIFPFSSPFAMLARAAQSGALWPHLLALAWQGLCVLIFVRFGASLFKRRVMKSGRSKPVRAK